jgi:DNA-binding GntR family transcriptional regulator
MDGKVTQKGLNRFRAELEVLRRKLGADYLDRIEQRVKEFHSEIIVALENIKGDA